jgi:hypothetical protein
MIWFMMRGGMRHRLSGGNAIEILKERFAKGEINQAELRGTATPLGGVSFRQRRRVPSSLRLSPDLIGLSVSNHMRDAD